MEQELTKGTKIDHTKYGEGIIANVDIASYEVYFARGGKMELSKSNTDITVLEQGESTDVLPKISLADIEKVFDYFIERTGASIETVELGDKWTGGTLILKPKDTSLKTYELPLDSFFHKIVMLRDRLRVLEQNINSNDKLTDEEKVNIQQYITRCYGSLTSFNVMFKNKEDHFVGAGK